MDTRCGSRSLSLLLLLSLLGLSACESSTAGAPYVPPPPPRTSQPVFANPCVVTRIYDGDTFACIPANAPSPLVIRLLYVDAPETAQRLGSASTAILRDALPVNSTIGLRFDRDSLDSFGRTLAWIETASRSNLNLYLADDGWATDLIIAPNTALSSEVRAAVTRARSAPRGLWARGFANCLPGSFRRGDCSD